MKFKEITVEDMTFNPFTRTNKDWILIAAGDEEENNLMTASWGLFGTLWRKSIVEIFIRPQRYTKKFADENDMLTISFLPDGYREALKICGTKSGKDMNKWEAAGLHPYYVDGTVGVEEAELIIVGKKQYTQWVDPTLFIEKENDIKCYPEKDYHEMYMLEIVRILQKEK